MSRPLQPGWGLALGEVLHRRLRPTGHAFRYPALFIRVPVHQLDGGASGSGWFGANRRALIAFRESDHGDGAGQLRTWIAEVLGRAGLVADGDIWLDTFPRMLGYAFKPVSFWHCHDKTGAKVAILAEVNNTFGERHCYLLPARPGHALRDGQPLRAAKHFHVSPFCAVDGAYVFRFLQAGPRVLARVEHVDSQGPILVTSLSGKLASPDAGRCVQALLGRPLFTLGVIARIHWQALKLFARGVPVHRKPAAPEQFVSMGSS